MLKYAPITFVVLAALLAYGVSGNFAIAQEQAGQQQEEQTDIYASHDTDDTELTSSDDQSASNFVLEDGQELSRSELSQDYYSQIKEVLSNDDFARKETVTGWRWIDTEDETTRKEKIPGWIITIIEFLEHFAGAFAGFALAIELLLWAGLIALFAYVFYRYHDNIRTFVNKLGNQPEHQELPTTLLGLDVKKESLPKHIVKSASQLWSAGEHRQAIALLLRATLIKLIHENAVQLYDSDTESECCERVDEQAPKPQSGYLRSLVSAWQSIAYAHTVPSEQTFKSLCDGWSTTFANTSKVPYAK